VFFDGGSEMNLSETMMYLEEPYDPVKVIQDLLEHAVYDRERNDECYDAVQNALGYLEQEGVSVE